jgi:predicted acetyltransferase
MCVSGCACAKVTSMPQLITPTVDVHASFLLAMGEIQAEGGGGPDDDSLSGRWIFGWAERWADPAAFASFVGQLRADALEDSPRPAGHVPSTTLWWTDGPEYLGRLSIRHRLTERLREIGGHIGYDVRPTARRRGHAMSMLATALPVARSMGIDRVLITCDAGNVGSRKVIEANGGVLEDERHGKLRFWAPTS